MLLQKDTGEVKKVIGESAIPDVGEITKLVTDPLSAFKDVIGIIKSQVTEIDDTFKKIENTIASLSLSFGGMRNFAQSIRENILDATTGVMSLGGSLEDVVEIQKGVIKGLQTQTILNKDSFEGLYSAGALLNDGAKATSQSTQKLTTEFVNAGYSIYDVSKQVLGIVNESRAQGVIVSAVYSQITANMNKLALYNFENGVQGMAQMAAKAASLRIDMKGTLDVAEKLFDPKNAIELAADMQRLGVNVASLLDPYKLMDMKNDPKKLQEEIIKATEQLVYFDKVNDKISILPEAQQTLRELAKAFGYGSEEFAKMAINAGELKIKLRELKFSADFEGDEETKNIIANMAQRKDNKYVITFDEYNKQTGNIESVTKEVSQLTKDNKAAILKSAEPAQSLVELQRSANLSLINMALDIKAMRSVLPRSIVRSATLATNVAKIGKEGQSFSESAKKAIGFETKRYNGGSYTDPTEFNKRVSKIGDITIDVVDKLVKGQIDIDVITKEIKSNFTSITDYFVEKLPPDIRKLFEKGQTDNSGNKKKNVTSKLLGETITYQKKYESVSPISSLPQNVKDRIIEQQVVQNNSQTQTTPTTVKGTSDEVNLNITLNVNPKDLQHTVMDYLKTEEIRKEIVKIYKSRIIEEETIRGGKLIKYGER